MVATIVILGILEVETQWPVCLSGHESRSSLFYTACWTTGEAHVSLLDSAVAASAWGHDKPFPAVLKSFRPER